MTTDLVPDQPRPLQPPNLSTKDDDPGPPLVFATTRELLDELGVRFSGVVVIGDNGPNPDSPGPMMYFTDSLLHADGMCRWGGKQIQQWLLQFTASPFPGTQAAQSGPDV